MLAGRWITLARLRVVAGPKQFARKEDGTVTVFSLLMFVLMVGVGGIAIDIMRYETQRVQLQNTLDRAILAAASTRQAQDAEEVVRDYFRASGLTGYRLRVNVENGAASRRFIASAEIDMNAMFMHLFGVRALTPSAFGVATEGARDVEVSLVLDISSSMSTFDRMTNLKPAARDFVTGVLRGNTNAQNVQRASISIVPYDSHVNVGTRLASVFTLTDEHDYSRCALFERQHFAVSGLDPRAPLQRMSHLDWGGGNGWTDPVLGTFSCPRDDHAAILPWSSNEAELHALINSLQPLGMTAIDLGMRWGVALLDPMARPALDSLAASGSVHADFRGRPAAYSDPETLKVVVLMTDGDITGHHDVNPAYRSGPSPFWRDPDDGHFSVHYAQLGLYWQEQAKEWSTAPDGGANNNAVQLDYADLWNHVPVDVMQTHLFDWDACAGEHWWLCSSVQTMGGAYEYRIVTHVPVVPSEADRRLRQLCDVARASGIVVFSIAFQAPPQGRELMSYCATTDAHYYEVYTADIADAFASIGQTISVLRLVQ